MEKNNSHALKSQKIKQSIQKSVVYKKFISFFPIIIIVIFVAIAIFAVGYIALLIDSPITKTYAPTAKSPNQLPTIPAPLAIPVPTDFPIAKLQGKAAYINNDNLWINDNNAVKQLTTDAIRTKIPYRTGLPQLWYSNPQISPNGKLISFLKNSRDNTNNRSLYIIGIDGNGIKKLTDNVDWGDHLLQWSNDSSSIYYTYNPLNHIKMIGEVTKIYKVSVVTENREEVGKYTVVEGGCGGGSDDAADHVAANEGLARIGGAMFFQLSNDYLIHTVNCFRSGTSVLNLKTNTDQLLDNKAGKATISPSGLMIAAVNDRILVFYSKTGALLKTLTPLETPTNLLWSPDEKTLYYVSEKTVRVSSINRDTLNTTKTTRINTSTIRKISLDTQQDTKIANFNSNSIKLIYIKPDNSTLIASLIENSAKLHNYLLENKSENNIVKYYPSVNLIEVNLANGNAKAIIKGAQQISYLPL